MRAPIVLGLAIGCGGLIAAEHAFPEDAHSWRFKDPDLMALEKLGAQAKKAMDAFVLRPRVADSYENICLGCMPVVARAPLGRIERASVSIASPGDGSSGAEAPQSKRPRYASLAPGRHVKRTTSLRQKVERRMHRLKRSVRRIVMVRPVESWEAELRR